MNIPKTGQNGSVGLMVTKTVVVLGDPQVTAPPGRPRGAMLRAYDKNNGTEVGAVLDAGRAERLADDLHGRRQAVHRRRGQRRQLLGRVHRVRVAERGDETPASGSRRSGPAGSRSEDSLTQSKKGKQNDTNIETHRAGGNRHRRRGGVDDRRAAHDGPTLGTGSGIPEHQERRVAVLHRRRQGLALLAARSDQRQQLQQARGRLAVQDRQPRHAPRVQARRHAADGQGRRLRDRRHAPLGGRARRQDRRDDLGPRREGRRPRRQRAAPALGPRPLLLDRRQG